jgi:hypothetical protein
MSRVSGLPETDYWEHRGQAWLVTAFLLAPTAWALNELIGYALVKPVCASGHKLLLTGLSAGMLAVVVAGAWIGWWCLTQLRSASQTGGSRVDRSYFFALVTIGFNLIIGLLILVAAVPPFVLNPCE